MSIRLGNDCAFTNWENLQRRPIERQAIFGAKGGYVFHIRLGTAIVDSKDECVVCNNDFTLKCIGCIKKSSVSSRAFASLNMTVITTTVSALTDAVMLVLPIRTSAKVVDAKTQVEIDGVDHFDAICCHPESPQDIEQCVR